MHDLKPVTALGQSAPVAETIGTITIAENDTLALASVAARMGHEEACHAILKKLIGAVPGPGKAQLHDPQAGFWTGPDQWMVSAPRETHELLADTLTPMFGQTATITEQSGAWVCFDVTGAAMSDLCERLCAVPIRKMDAGGALRTMIHQMGCFVIRCKADDHIRILGPRASANSLHHALTTAAHSIA
ncbi:sarcosine oxidase subunit gamma [Yoonia sediminilitoris]|uniref:Sarcosine oxidase subunit gamma n=1 Tax=Yoonia sediminilitoris TaxID=1286148 RepID=A0A2T6KMW1_9RHOB|nr:sarcosine oxidase subunit gamma [Yoonia sediminilitoris]PUB17521.1 sarcosine oxidase subunit gamma [Yoonia sediminilitoris]RCW97816.1 sarcosine oxidase subunit gamma [Yoonia sediminilitoris]